jgi:hypothetical protein
LESLNDAEGMKVELSTILTDTIKKDVKTRHAIKNVPEFTRIANYIFD